MEKTLARALYKHMELGKTYSTRDLCRLIGDDYYKYIPAENHPNQPHGFPMAVGVTREMWKVVTAGFAKTYTGTESVGIVRGLKFGTKPTAFDQYTARYWIRTK